MYRKALRVVVVAWSAVFSESVFAEIHDAVARGRVDDGMPNSIVAFCDWWDLLADAHPSSYHRVLSHRRWSMWPLARALAEYIVSAFYHKGVIRLVGDETVTEHPGKKVFGKGAIATRNARRTRTSRTCGDTSGSSWRSSSICREPAVRGRCRFSSRCTATRRTTRPWDCRHKTPTDLMRQLLCVMLRWFPARKFVFSGDGGYGTHALTRFAHRHRKQIDAGQSLSRRRQPVCSSSQVEQEIGRSTAGQREETTQPGSHRAAHEASEEALRQMVRRRKPDEWRSSRGPVTGIARARGSSKCCGSTSTT